MSIQLTPVRVVPLGWLAGFLGSYVVVSLVAASSCGLRLMNLSLLDLLIDSLCSHRVSLGLEFPLTEVSLWTVSVALMPMELVYPLPAQGYD